MQFVGECTSLFFVVHFLFYSLTTVSFSQISLPAYGVSPVTGFLPEHPQFVLPMSSVPWYRLACYLSKYLLTGKLRSFIEQLPPYEPDTDMPAETGMRMLSYLGHAYLWGDAHHVPDRLPARLSDAWCMVAEQVGRPPILSYPSYCLYNYRVIDPAQPPYIGNIEIVQNFLGGADEDWFILIHVDIEARAAQALRVIPDALLAAHTGDLPRLTNALKEVEAGLGAMNATMLRMPEYCDPYIYYTRVRPYIFGTKNNPALPNGLVYEGHFDNQPQLFRGETGAQSAIVPTIDGLLGIEHANDPLREYLMEMRTYMVPAHRRFIEAVESRSQVRAAVEANPDNVPLNEVYQACVGQLYAFRAKHLEYAATYIHKQGMQANNSTSVGTGGTPFMQYLAKHRDETKVVV